MQPKPFFVIVLAALLFPAAARSGERRSESSFLGFNPESTKRQRELEKHFDSLLTKENLRVWMKKMSARPHHAGSPFGKENAEFIASQFRLWGYDTQVEEFQVLFPTPKIRVLEMVAPERFSASLVEPALKEDSTSGLFQEQLPTYNAYSIDGEVTGKLVYVNYGVPKDYSVLDEKGIDVKGAIVLVRYGGSWRGIKPRVAAEHGAIGCIIYSDPREDGYFQGDVYPKGAWRNDSGAQRGSVADIPLFPGDPLTPGIGATKDAARLSIKDAPTLTKIPVLPISYADALPLLRNLDGPSVPEEWRGALPVTYHFGPGPATVHLRVAFDWQQITAYDVIARLRGSERPDQWIIRGNHHDAWVCGADDPISGLVDLMEEARAIAELVKGGWQPKRTIVFAAWDAEEPGLLGSTEWVETHADLLGEKAAVYINGDNNGRGFLSVGGSHTLEKLVNEVARDVIDPEKKIPVADRLRAYRIARGSAEERREVRERTDLRINALGSGSDYTPFLQHLGIASLDIRYGGEDGGGSYHSIYDSFDHYTRFGDPGFDYGIALAQTAGRVILRLANAEILPFEFTNFADTIKKYLKELAKLADDLRDETKEMNRQIQEKTLEAVFDPTQTYVIPNPKSSVPYFNFAPLENAVARLQELARNLEGTFRDFGDAPELLSNEAQKSLDNILLSAERTLLLPQGLPRRPWFRHLIYAPGFYTGYGVKTFPGVREAIEERNWTEADQQIEIAAKSIERFSAEIEKTQQVLEKARRK